MDDLIQFYVFVDDDYQSEDNVVRTSLVDNPATQKLFAVFGEEAKNKNLAFKVVEPTAENKQVVKSESGKFSRIVSGVWFMPDVDYYRVLDDFEFTTSITRDELKKAVVNYTKAGKQNEFDVMHDGDPIEGLKTVEIWILEDYKQLSPIFGYSIEDLGYKQTDIPLGTVLMSVFVENEKFFNDEILSGNLKGFSIEALFNINQKFSKQISVMKQKQMFAAIGLVQTEGALITTKGELKFSKDKIELGDKQVQKGTFKLKSGFSVEIRDGVVVDFGFEENGGGEGGDNAGGGDNGDNGSEGGDDNGNDGAGDDNGGDDNNNNAGGDDGAGGDVGAVVAKAVADALEKREAKEKAAKEKADKEAADAEQKAEIERLKQENEDLKKGGRIPVDSSVKTSDDYDKTKFREVKVGNKTRLVLK